ncbi:MAG: hypothetical protein AAGE96_11600 [Cyanobacteria bacterium P01_G01_bin.19]
MSPRKLTEDDKQEILQLYRNSEATTSTLANRYEVSSSTISRFLKNKLSTMEYEDLIQQKRLARTPRGEKTATKEETKPKKAKASTTKKSSKVKKTRKKAEKKPVEVVEEKAIALPEVESAEVAETIESKSVAKRRRRRRSSAKNESKPLDATAETPALDLPESSTEVEDLNSSKLVIDKASLAASDEPELEKPAKNNGLILKSEKVEDLASNLEVDEDEDEEDDDQLDLITLKEMLGEDLEDINDEEDDEDDDDWDEEGEENIRYSRQDSGFSDVEILPLSQAQLPRTCYLVIDRAAELIVKPLAEFGDLGEIPQDEIRQRTLPVFDNHRIAKRFSHRRERVIKVPDGRMLQKTSRHLQEKGITRLLIDGQVYSLSAGI